MSNSRRRKSASDVNTLDDSAKQELIEELWNCIIDEEIAEIACIIHREHKLGTLSQDPISTNFECICPQENDEKVIEYEQKHDLFGHKLGVPMNQTIPCVHCNRSVNATRFAPHLEKCMGFGRNSSRIANRRLATYNQDQELLKKRPRDCIIDDDYDDEEYEEDIYY